MPSADEMRSDLRVAARNPPSGWVGRRTLQQPPSRLQTARQGGSNLRSPLSGPPHSAVH